MDRKKFEEMVRLGIAKYCEREGLAAGDLMRLYLKGNIAHGFIAVYFDPATKLKFGASYHASENHFYIKQFTTDKRVMKIIEDRDLLEGLG